MPEGKPKYLAAKKFMLMLKKGYRAKGGGRPKPKGSVQSCSIQSQPLLVCDSDSDDAYDTRDATLRATAS